MIAYVDESLRTTPGGLYVIAAAVVLTEPDEARQVALSVLLRGQRRYHWRDESEAQRHRMLDAMADLELLVLGYVRRPVDQHAHERARVLCLRRLLWDLRGVEELIIESRHKAADQRDRRSIVQAQQEAEGELSGLVYDFQHPDREPLLWFADAAAGAVAASAAGETDAYLAKLPGCDVVDVADP